MPDQTLAIHVVWCILLRVTSEHADMSIPRPQWILSLAAGLMLCIANPVMAQTHEPAPSPFRPHSVDGSRFRDNRDRGLSESARRFGSSLELNRS